jgi:hypothetical protein
VQVEIGNGSCAGVIEPGHGMLLSLAGGSARISQSPTPGSSRPAIP